MPVPHRSGRDVGCLSTNTMSGSNSFICMCGLKPAHQVQTTSKGGRKGQIDRPKSIKPQPDKRPRTRNVPPQATPTVFAKSSSDTTSESHKDEIHGRVLPRQFSCGHGYMGYHNGSVRGYEAPTEFAKLNCSYVWPNTDRHPQVPGWRPCHEPPQTIGQTKGFYDPARDEWRTSWDAWNGGFDPRAAQHFTPSNLPAYYK